MFLPALFLVGAGFAPAAQLAVASGWGSLFSAFAGEVGTVTPNDSSSEHGSLCVSTLCFSTPRKQVDIGRKGIAHKAERKGSFGGWVF